MVLLYKAHQSIVEFLNTDADAPTCNRAEMAKEIAKVRQISNQESAGPCEGYLQRCFQGC